MRHHNGCKLLPGNKLVCKVKYVFRRLWVKRGRMFVKQKKFRLFQRRHKERKRLALASRKQTHFACHPILKAQTENFQLFMVELAFLFCYPPAKPSALPAPVSYCHVFFYLHICGGPAHWILKHPPHILRAFILGLPCNIVSAKYNRTAYNAVTRVNTCYEVQKGGFAGPVPSYYRNEIALGKMQVYIPYSLFLIYGIPVKSFAYLRHLKHSPHPFLIYPTAIRPCLRRIRLLPPYSFCMKTYL